MSSLRQFEIRPDGRIGRRETPLTKMDCLPEKHEGELKHYVSATRYSRMHNISLSQVYAYIKEDRLLWKQLGNQMFIDSRYKPKFY